MELSELIKMVEWAYANPARTLQVNIKDGVAPWAIARDENGYCHAVESLVELINLAAVEEAAERAKLVELQAKYGKGD